MTSATNTREVEASPPIEDENLLRIGQAMARMRLLTGRRMIGRLAIQSVAPGLELSHLDVLDVVRRAEAASEVTVGTIAEMLRIDPSRASRIVADMVARGVLRRKASQADARRIVVVLTALGQRLLSEIQAQKYAVIGSIFADWTQEEIADFSVLFDRYVTGYEQVFQARLKETDD
ncbi:MULTISPECIES: MarR family winged helix-turn-helix transcriptional regulator [unclassified Rhizobium]|uniref:MarR family winged helix-turn-helix transcriptional regulator n=1 Tax=unclassified Rhizobium TaxID=2613769 RepID=UPI000AB214EC|nr:MULTISPECIES: MarR family winged helix-turn-helix transcriptional regulator [unclassified Rhizobium]MBN8952748.1 winged helix-turn-helix transcriptional regulator [Rhizobium tropici]RKD55241.1 MarR family transcriptional regulator [Rhizobium sp. WW_1]